jgi:hypothetical protein
MLRCFFGCDKIETVIKEMPFDEFMIKLMDDATLVTISPLMIIFGKYPY